MFYLYNQNNSGGVWDTDENLAHRVAIEAPSLCMANGKAQEIGIYFNGVEIGSDCECCGDRWHDPDELDISKDELVAHAQELSNKYGWATPDIIIHYLDGTKQEVSTNKK